MLVCEVNSSASEYIRIREKRARHDVSGTVWLSQRNHVFMEHVLECCCGIEHLLKGFDFKEEAHMGTISPSL